ncbi:MAG: ATP-dependent protease ATPase subunit HslU [Syntrophaceticus sp.]|nr:ATP-dependent protease ATPase subunit HslU [Syntrophaceticus sp.]MDD3313887.1 ATP-dependent protease ATPase subunit HslU [Syntrophaceticus sp.]MDD4358965.1 ATP-dependent protease ATPase subunit HslU [Syntrophaceticus sp.]MDD4782537.1 ATP-dependent protease ATPase subunit HslU [Syntrophaceticus sp.]
MDELTPQQIVAELDRFIVGQQEAKRAVAVALRNRYRRRRLPQDLQDEIIPKNIIMIGPTGVGKTEIARRMAKLVKAPFVKVEATRFTEVGYVGKDVESMVRDLIEVAIRMVKQEKVSEVGEKADRLAEERILDILVPSSKGRKPTQNPLSLLFGEMSEKEEKVEIDTNEQNTRMFREKVAQELRSGVLEERQIEIEIEESHQQSLDVFSLGGMEEMGINVQDMLGNFLPKKKKKRSVTVRDARRILAQEEAQNLVDMDEVISQAIERAEQSGIIFLDEIDKISGRENTSGPDVSRGGVQRDILPIIEGSTVMTKHGPVKTDYMLFIAAGAFHVSKPSDLIPELQGRFPIRVELQSLERNDLLRILREPDNSLIRQYTALLQTERVDIEFTTDALEEIAEMAYIVNTQAENIGARRLHTILEKVLEDLSFQASELHQKKIVIDKNYVSERIGGLVADGNLSGYIL